MVCKFCGLAILIGEDIRPIRLSTGQIHPQFHTYPDGKDGNNNPVKDACKNNHGKEPHIHERCVEPYCRQTGVDIPVTFKSGDTNRMIEEVTGKSIKSLQERGNDRLVKVATVLGVTLIVILIVWTVWTVVFGMEGGY